MKSYCLWMTVFCLSLGLIAAGERAAAAGEATAVHATDASAIPINGDNVANLLPWMEAYVEGSPVAALELTFYFSPTGTSSGLVFSHYHAWLQPYIDSGQVRVRYQEITHSQNSKRIAAMLHCLPKEQYLDTITHILALNASEQPKMQPINTYMASVIKKNKIADSSFSACFNNPALVQGLQNQNIYAQAYFDVQKVPVLIFGNTAYRVGSDATEAVVDALLQQLLPPPAASSVP